MASEIDADETLVAAFLGTFTAVERYALLGQIDRLPDRGESTFREIRYRLTERGAPRDVIDDAWPTRPSSD